MDKRRTRLMNRIVATLILLFNVNTTSAQTTAFNYQGRLTDAGNPASANFDLQFKLFDTVAGGVQQGVTLVRTPVAVNAGNFTVTLDFGANVFDGAARFLEIGVRAEGDANPYTVLAPRQPINSTPYAIQTVNAQKLGGLPASAYVTTASVGNAFIKNDTAQQPGANLNISGNGLFGGSVGIGTTTPQSKLAVQANGYGITQTDGTVTVGSFINPGAGWLGTKSNHPLNFFTNDSVPQMTLAISGNVGIGTTTPTTRLFVLSGTPGLSAIYGESATGRAVWGKSTSSRGVYGESTSLEGVYGISSSGTGVSGASTSGSGVFGQTAVASPTAGGVYGLGIGNDSLGVIGESNNGNNAVGVYGVTSSANGFGMFARNNAAGGRAFYADGHAGQGLSGFGLIKAMIHVDRTGAIISCYNGVTFGLNCGGITITKPLTGVYRINFGFPVNGRFVSITPEYATTCNVIPIQCRNAGANFRFFDTNSLEVFTFNADNSADTADAAFMIIVY